MSKNPKKWIDRWIGEKSLPALRRTTTDLEDLYKSDDPFEHLSDVIHRDPGMACHVLTCANSVQHQHFGMPVTTIEHAAMMLGLDRIKSIPEKLAVIEPEKSDVGRRELLSTYSRSHHAATQAAAWARLRADMVPLEVFAATLLHNLGEMAIWAFQPDKAEEIDDLVHGTGHQSRETAQLHVLGFTCNALSIELARLWKLPLLVHDSLNHENAEKPRIKIILLAHEIARNAEKNWYSDMMTSHINEASGLLHCSYTDMVNVIHQAALTAASASQTFGITPAAAHLVMTPPPRTGMTKNNSSSSQKEEKNEKTLTSGAQRLYMEPQPQILEQTINWFSKKHDSPPGIPAIMKQAVQGIHKGIGLYRVVFATCTPDQKSLRARIVCSSDQSAEFEHFHMDLQPPHLFTQLMEKPTSIWVNDENRDRLKDLLPSSLLNALDADSFFARSVFSGNRPVGMLYCDCHRDSSCLNEERYREFQHVCDFVTAAMDKFGKQVEK